MTSTTETTDVQAVQFNGLDDYLRIVGWMKDCGDTYALADEIRYTTPIMLLQTAQGMVAASPGDWIVRGTNGGFSVADHGKAEAPTVRTWRVQYNPGQDIDAESETFIDADTYERGEGDHHGNRWIEFRRDGRKVAEVREGVAILIEELRPLNPSEREELESLRETVAILDDPDAVADLARAMAETREAAAQDRDRATDDEEESQTDWSAYHACATCGQPTGKPCLFAEDKAPRINPHQYRERLPAA